MIKGKNQFDCFRNEVNEALRELAEKYNFDIKASKIKYDDTSMDLTVKINDKEVSGKSFEQTEFERMCSWYGLTPEDYGRQFMSNGNKFTLCGFKPRATKMPILARNENGQGYKFTEESIKRLINAQ